jgi:hypothetical protein
VQPLLPEIEKTYYFLGDINIFHIVCFSFGLAIDMISFVCEFIACLQMCLGIGPVVVQSGNALVYSNFRQEYFCKIECKAMCCCKSSGINLNSVQKSIGKINDVGGFCFEVFICCDDLWRALMA